jgi:Amt family ammonium transporter
MGIAGRGATGLLHGDTNQFLCQLIGAGINIVWAFGVTFILFKIINAIKPIRVSPEAEAEGLDVPEFGGLAYPEDAILAPARNCAGLGAIVRNQPRSSDDDRRGDSSVTRNSRNCRWSPPGQ